MSAVVFTVFSFGALERLARRTESTPHQHPSWSRKIGYYLAFYYLGPADNREKARQELAKLGPITNKEEDLELLQLYGDLEFDYLPFAARMEILDRILELDDDRDNQLQYRGAKAIQYFMIGDTQTAERQVAEVIDMVRQTEADEPLGGTRSTSMAGCFNFSAACDVTSQC
jgi:hypothetical protein